MSTLPLDPARTTVAVLMGGTSAEREVSLNTGANCADALRQAGFTVTTFDTADLSFIDNLRAYPPDVAFIALHGTLGEDGAMQGLLEILGIPYTGSRIMASAIAMDKAATKGVYAQAGLPVAEDVLLVRDAVQLGDGGYVPAVADIPKRLGQRLVVKPNAEGSSVGVHIVHSAAELPAALDEAFTHDAQVLVERFIPGLEIMAGVLDDVDGCPQALPLIEVEATGEFYDYDSKYAPGGSVHHLPARLDAAQTARCQELAVAAHRALGCRGCTRSDIRLDPDGQAWLIETNTLPGMTATSLVPEAARAAGISFPELVTRIVGSALSGR
ncbi:MAG: D-alanine--D-alanine ligase [Actinomycetes bacterium]|jgi:D-alanine-D-alanine ligase|nr:D-alanine--D-alanine ligase [Actinomycetes bacterium]